jgi:hypothetical protein
VVKRHKVRVIGCHWDADALSRPQVSAIFKSYCRNIARSHRNKSSPSVIVANAA